ncbi:hypothetical protein A2U01_0110003, partial [Trifolium medium]|nr:hypothetical protein [Trifolium medium]
AFVFSSGDSMELRQLEECISTGIMASAPYTILNGVSPVVE